MSTQQANGFGISKNVSNKATYGHGKAAGGRVRHGVNGTGWTSFSGREEMEAIPTENKLEAARCAWLAEKQAQLESVVDTHDSLVREAFQMKHFKIMTSYDPLEAKRDNSMVYQQFKQPYDLIEKAGPSRKTRRGHTGHLQLLTGSPSSSTIVTTPAKGNLKSKAKDVTSVWSIVNSTRYKRKGKEIHGISYRPVTPPPQTPVNEEKRKLKRSKFDDDIDLEPITFTKRKRTERSGNNPVHDIEMGTTMSQPPNKKGWTAHESISDGPVVIEKIPSIDQLMRLPELDESLSTGRARRSGRLKETGNVPELSRHFPLENKSKGNSIIAISSPKKTSISVSPRNPRDSILLEPKDTPILSVPPTPTTIKRVRLIVRRPPPSLTNPKQRAPPAKYKESLGNFLTSYTCLEDHDTNLDILQRKAVEEAALRECAERFRRDGRLLPDLDIPFENKSELLTTLTPSRYSKDQWDGVMDAVISRDRHKSKRPSGPQIAAQIASKIQTYWDGQEAKKDKLRQQEERRLKALAKATIKTVVAEWKKAVFHIREQERLKTEAEELRRGHEHLDAILNQSGHLLETQQGHLFRSRSRSSSMSDMHYWESDEDQDDHDGSSAEDDEDGESDVAPENIYEELEMDEDEELEGSEEEEEADEEEEEESVEDGTMLLLGDDSASKTAGLHQGDVSNNSESNGLDKEEVVFDKSKEPINVSMNIESDQFMAYAGSSSQPLQSSATPPDDQILLDKEPLTLQSSVINEDVNENSAFNIPLSEIAGGMDIAMSIPTVVGLEQESFLDAPDNINTALECKKSSASPEAASIAPTPPETVEETIDKALPEDGDPEMADEYLEGEADQGDDANSAEHSIPEYLKPYAVAPVTWDPGSKITPPLLLRGVLRPYQHGGLEWLASLHTNNLNGILADEMGLGKTIQTISLLAHLACNLGIWGPHLIVVPTSVLLNWEMEFKKFLPGFKVLSYHGSTKRRKELRQGWNDKHMYNVCITSYTLASRDAHIFKRKAWYYMILDEAHMIKNFRSQRWNILLMFRSFRRLLLTGTPLQNNLTELWALLQFLMSGPNFGNLKEFGDWFSNPLEKAIEMGNINDDETMQRVSKLHTVLRPYLLRRLKRDVEKELPSKYEHLVLCPLSKRQRFLYDEFMSRAQTKDALESGVYQKIANILMQLRKVCNHPDLFEVRPIVTSFAMQRSAIADFEIKELLIRRHWLEKEPESVNLDLLGLKFVEEQDTPLLTALETKRLDATCQLPHFLDTPGEPPQKDVRTITGFRAWSAYVQHTDEIARWQHIGYLNRIRCSRQPIYSQECLTSVRGMSKVVLPLSAVDTRSNYMDTVYAINSLVLSYSERAATLVTQIDKFAFVTPPVVALDLPRLALSGYEEQLTSQPAEFDSLLHRASVKLQIAFPDPSLLQYDCGKLQELTRLLQEKKAGGHRVLIFTQMTRILDILEIFLNFHGYLYLRLDGATKIEDRQYITERFNADSRVFCFIASSRSGGVGINLTGADTVIFYDSDFNPQMDRQCEDRAHRIGQIRDVHIYRFVSQYTIEESMLRKANQKRSLDDLVIQKGEFDWRTIFRDENALTEALSKFEDAEDARAANLARMEEDALEGADEDDFGGDIVGEGLTQDGAVGREIGMTASGGGAETGGDGDGQGDEGVEDEDLGEGGSVADYMLSFVGWDYEFFRDWRL